MGCLSSNMEWNENCSIKGAPGPTIPAISQADMTMANFFTTFMPPLSL